jgi:hypothetical protein
LIAILARKGIQDEAVLQQGHFSCRRTALFPGHPGKVEEVSYIFITINGRQGAKPGQKTPGRKYFSCRASD